MNQKWRCALPSPERPTWTRPISPTASTARSTRTIIGPSSAADGTAVAEIEVLARLEDHDHGRPHAMRSSSASALTASDLRNTLNQLLGEHAVLAMNATNLGVKGSKAFPAAAKALDRNSVELSQAIGSIYGAKAGKTFLDGPFMWRAHVRFFVDYTVALAQEGHGRAEQGRGQPEDLHREVR